MKSDPALTSSPFGRSLTLNRNTLKWSARTFLARAALSGVGNSSFLLLLSDTGVPSHRLALLRAYTSADSEAPQPKVAGADLHLLHRNQLTLFESANPISRSCGAAACGQSA